MTIGKIEPPSLSKKDIVAKADRLIKDYALLPEAWVLDRGILSFDEVYLHHIYPALEVVLRQAPPARGPDGQEILGQYDPWTNKILIRIPRRDARWAFTCYHEVGHAVLHGPHLRAQRDSRGVQVITTAASIDPRATATFEWQANTFAAHTAAPYWFVRKVLREDLGLTSARPYRYVGPGRYCFSKHGRSSQSAVRDFKHLSWRLASLVSWRFGGLSREALGYRLIEEGIAVDLTARRLSSASPPPQGPLPLYRIGS